MDCAHGRPKAREGRELSGQPESSLPQWAIDSLVWMALVLSAGLTTMLGWFLRKYIRKIDVLEENQKKFATVESVAQMELRMSPMISRTEFLAHLQQLREDTEKRNDQMREDRQRMHQENQNSLSNLHKRVDQLFQR